TTLTDNRSAGDTNVTVADASAFSVGDIVMIYDDEVGYLHDGVNSTKGELTKIKSIIGSTIEFVEPLTYDYYTTQNAKIRKLNGISNVRISNLRINGSNSTSTNEWCIYIYGGENIEIDHVECANVGYAGISAAMNVWRANLHDNVVHNVFYTGAGYGIPGGSFGSKHIRVYNNLMYDIDEGIDCGGSTSPGWPSHLEWKDNIILNANYGIDQHPTCHYTEIDNNKIIGANTYGIRGDGTNVKITNNKIFRSDGIAIVCGPALFMGQGVSDGCKVQGNTIYSPRTYGIDIEGRGHVVVEENDIFDQGRGYNSWSAIQVDAGSHNVTLAVNIIDTCYQGIDIESDNGTVELRGNVITNNRGEKYRTSGYNYVENIYTDMKMNGFDFLDVGDVGIGIDSPVAKLDVEQSDTSRSAMKINNQGNEFGLWLYTNTGSSANRYNLFVECDNSAFDQTCSYIQNDGTKYGQYIKNSGNAHALVVDNQAAVSSTVNAILALAGSGGIAFEGRDTTNNRVFLGRHYTDTTASNWFYRNYNAGNTSAPLVLIEQANADDDQESLQIKQQGTGAHITLTGTGIGGINMNGFSLYNASSVNTTELEINAVGIDDNAILTLDAGISSSKDPLINFSVAGVGKASIYVDDDDGDRLIFAPTGGSAQAYFKYGALEIRPDSGSATLKLKPATVNTDAMILFQNETGSNTFAQYIDTSKGDDLYLYNYLDSLNNLVVDVGGDMTLDAAGDIVFGTNITGTGGDLLNWTTLRQVNNDGLVLYLPFSQANYVDSSLTLDSSPKQNDATVVGAVFNATGGFNGGGAYYFDGDNDRIDIDSVTNLNKYARTLTIWANDYEPSATAFLYSEDATEWGLVWQALHRIITKINGTDKEWSCAGESALAGNEWHFYAQTYDGTYLRVYLDGMPCGSWTVTDGIPHTTNKRIGGATSNGFWFNGSIDEVRIYNRSLNADEIRNLYEQRAVGSDAYVKRSGNSVVYGNITADNLYLPAY
ncbi:MAG: hypothetical protein DRP27_09450, partial [Thermotogae bacterium]